MRKWLFISLMVICIASCKNNQYNIIPRRDLVPLLVDMHIADAMALSTKISENFGGLDSTLLYQAVLDKYGYTRDNLDQTLQYYSSKPEKLIGIYDDVFSELSKQSEQAKTLYSSTTVSQTYPIWKSKKTRYTVRDDSASYPPAFDVKIDTSGTFVLSVKIRIFPDDESINPRILAYFYNPFNDNLENRVYFEEIPLLKSTYWREFTILKECNDTSLSMLRIIIPMHDSIDLTFRKKFDIKDLQVDLLQSKKKK